MNRQTRGLLWIGAFGALAYWIYWRVKNDQPQLVLPGDPAYKVSR